MPTPKAWTDAAAAILLRERKPAMTDEGTAVLQENTRIFLEQQATPEPLEALYRLFFILERLDHVAQAGSIPLVQVTSTMWRDQISPDIRLVRSSLDRKVQP